MGRYSPGALAPAALDINRVLELEIGYLWVWPSLTFSRGDSPARLVDDPGWAPAVLVLLLLASVAIVLLRQHAQRSDPLR